MHKSLLNACVTPHSDPLVCLALLSTHCMNSLCSPQAATSLGITRTNSCGWRKGWGRDPTTIFGIYHVIFSSFSPKGCWHSPSAASSLYFKLSWSPLTVTDLFPAQTGISALLQGKNLNFNKIPTKSLIAVGIILWSLCAHSLISLGKRFYLPRIKIKADRQPSNQGTSQKTSDYSRKHLTAWLSLYLDSTLHISPIVKANLSWTKSFSNLIYQDHSHTDRQEL